MIHVSNTIVLALDGTEQSRGPVRYAKEIAHDRDANVVVVHVKELIASRAAGPLHTDEDVRIASVRSQVADLRSAGIATELRMSSTLRNPATAIAAAARRAGADLIVVGGTKHAALAGALAGSTPQSLLHTSPCPVLVAPAAAATSRDAARTPIAA